MKPISKQSKEAKNGDRISNLKRNLNQNKLKAKKKKKKSKTF